MKLPDSEVTAFPTLLYGTIEGSLGLLASVPPTWFAFLAALQVWKLLREEALGVRVGEAVPLLLPAFPPPLFPRPLTPPVLPAHG